MAFHASLYGKRSPWLLAVEKQACRGPFDTATARRGLDSNVRITVELKSCCAKTVGHEETCSRYAAGQAFR